MQWKSLLLYGAIAESALARSHGHQRRQHSHGHAERAPEAHLAAREVVVETVVNYHTITMTSTITGVAPTVTTHEDAATTTSDAAATTTSDAAATTSATEAAAFVELDLDEDLAISASLSLGLSIGGSEATTTSSASSSSTKAQAHTTTTTSAAASSSSAAGVSSAWYTYPTNGVYSTSGFGARTNTTSSSGDTYVGNVGNPWGSNIIEVSASEAWQYKYVVQFTGQNSEDWFVSIWNKIGPDGADDGFFGHSALNFTLASGETRYVAFDENSQGGWGAAEGSSLPTNDYGEYSCTWGEFDFGDEENSSWSGWDVSAIVAEEASQTIQGMKLCRHGTSTGCSYITSGGDTVENAYTPSESSVGGIGGSVSAGPLRLAAVIDYSG
ncbi:putative allergen Asp F4-like [Aspergillus saccharolyticus JOP 1030-1]|uniref:Allergen Asp f 4 n=1 Tax=Aspergillus saccharolyticus JOP 1030-1 TaxID=1450539 RepID=A0A319A536_9EURO|nr:hypothetical protein BP01DRAFT_368134 [Aspergillus saccharolyticus JOP 1030-1]PYH42522.1 hypothetical protein BP01DRAFT_368134 [Aspergillus saccharolyticus JOP 1030-1]